MKTDNSCGIFNWLHYSGVNTASCFGNKLARMSTILVKTTANTNNNTLAKSIAIPIPILILTSSVNINTNTFVRILFTNYYIQQRSFFTRSSINEVNRMIVVERWENHYRHIAAANSLIVRSCSVT